MFTFPLQPNYTAIINTCNLWRNFDDIQDSWSSVASVIDHYGDNQDVIIANAGPGHWNDPDMVRNCIYTWVVMKYEKLGSLSLLIREGAVV